MEMIKDVQNEILTHCDRDRLKTMTSVCKNTHAVSTSKLTKIICDEALSYAYLHSPSTNLLIHSYGKNSDIYDIFIIDYSYDDPMYSHKSRRVYYNDGKEKVNKSKKGNEYYKISDYESVLEAVTKYLNVEEYTFLGNFASLDSFIKTACKKLGLEYNYYKDGARQEIDDYIYNFLPQEVYDDYSGASL